HGQRDFEQSGAQRGETPRPRGTSQGAQLGAVGGGHGDARTETTLCRSWRGAHASCGGGKKVRWGGSEAGRPAPRGGEPAAAAGCKVQSARCLGTVLWSATRWWRWWCTRPPIRILPATASRARPLCPWCKSSNGSCAWRRPVLPHCVSMPAEMSKCSKGYVY